MPDASHNTARQIFRESLAACTVEAAVARSLRREEAVLHAGERHYDLNGFAEAAIISLGKAAASLFDAVLPLVNDRLPVRAVISGPQMPARRTDGVEFFAGGHPFPTQASLDAGPRTLMLFLVSGGGSSLMEAPAPEINLPDLIAFNRWLVGSGLDIRAINTLRKRVSAFKGGRLAAAAAGAGAQLSLLVSDVPAGALDTLASGPTFPDPASATDAECPLRNIPEDALPASIRHALNNSPATATAGDAAFLRAHWLVLLSNDSLLEAAAASARRLGYEPVIDNRCDDWDVRDAAAFLLERFHQLQRFNPRACLLSGGEVTVRLPQTPGIGGRNSQFALECARLLHAKKTRATVLSAGSDGVDGLSPAAGAIADETTWQRGENAQTYLDRFHAYPFFAALGDAVVTGPTGNNLRDLRVLLPPTD